MCTGLLGRLGMAMALSRAVGLTIMSGQSHSLPEGVNEHRLEPKTDLISILMVLHKFLFVCLFDLRRVSEPLLCLIYKMGIIQSY